MCAQLLSLHAVGVLASAGRGIIRASSPTRPAPTFVTCPLPHLAGAGATASAVGAAAVATHAQ